MSKTRTFVAIAASADVRERAMQAIEQLRSSADNVKWVAPENMHLTLKFLGDVPATEIAQVCRAVERGAAELEGGRVEAAESAKPQK